jgi:hypothetical protein
VAQVGTAVTDRLVGLLRAQSGLAFGITAVSLREGIELVPIAAPQVVPENISFDLIEKTGGAKYPQVHAYCDRLVNDLKEKFRSFSGRAHLAIEVRVSQDRLDGLDRQLQLYVEAATHVLDAHRGDWGGGMFYPGGYEIAFAAVRPGGRNFIKTAKVTFAVDVSAN